MRHRIFDALHSLSHPGIRCSRRLVLSSFVWAGFSKDVSAWARSCIECQCIKNFQHFRSAVPQVPVPARRFSHIHVDLLGPLPSSRGFTYLFTILDRTSRWPEAVPLASISAADCARALISGWILRFGVPAKITSAHGAQFTFSICDVLCSLLNITHSRTRSFHPQSNSLVERFLCSLKSSLIARLAGPDWFNHLHLVLLGLWSVPHDDSGFSAAVALYGDPLCLPGEFLDSDEPPPAVFQDRIQSVLGGLVLPPPHHKPPFTARVPGALSLAEYVLFMRTSLSDLCPSSTVVPIRFYLAPPSFLLYRLDPGLTQSP